MPTFIDESGGFGWDNDQAKTYFTLAAVWFETPDAAFACEEVIAGVRIALQLPAAFQFHFTEINHDQRMAFLRAVSVCNFEYVTCTLLKQKQGRWLLGREWRKRDYFFEKIIAPVVQELEGKLQLAQQNKNTPLNEHVVHDKNTDQIYLKTLRNQFIGPKAPTGRSLVKKVREGPKSDDLIQLVDMVCGAVVNTFDASSVYENLLKGRKMRDNIYLP